MKKIILLGTLLVMGSACSKSFLEEVPNSNILTPQQAEDFQRLLDNSEQIGITAALPHLASDEYYISSEKNWLASRTATERSSYIWDKDIFGGELNINDWNAPYRSIFYANNIINEIERHEPAGRNAALKDIYGQARFHRASAYFDLVKNFSVPFDAKTQQTDLGVPLRKDPSIDYTLQRATVSECYDLIFEDLNAAVNSLAYGAPLPERNRATKLAAFALLSRIHMYRREYEKAEQFADSLLNRYDKLIDYNEISQTSNTPFTRNNDELIMYGATVNYSNAAQINNSQTVFVDSTLIKLYAANDLRLSIYFIYHDGGKYTMKRGYNGTGLTPFNGLAVDEVLLNKIECLVRRGILNDASHLMERLLLHRYRAGTYSHKAFVDQASALQFVLDERRKELVWRCLRWDDIKRLNKEGRNIILTRHMGDTRHRLEPNMPRYIFNIPQDEINRSGIIQNIR